MTEFCVRPAVRVVEAYTAAGDSLYGDLVGYITVCDAHSGAASTHLRSLGYTSFVGGINRGMVDRRDPCGCFGRVGVATTLVPLGAPPADVLARATKRRAEASDALDALEVWAQTHADAEPLAHWGWLAESLHNTMPEALAQQLALAVLRSVAAEQERQRHVEEIARLRARIDLAHAHTAGALDV
ncbi:hypothetical protein D5S18_18465 [Nocardia panacis]|uniref:Uncharacterized protein n=1 Tax=Nocardia panacis TaxID=2340916 RepID=A0A3A4K2K4_9NOCA|nr:hypothetical protein [Nocardia panacis]RJO74137.1 hypothetical protein D5S18_18465 [Nocardia panacis]